MFHLRSGVINLFQTKGQIHTCLSARGNKLINQDNLLKLHDHLLIMLLNYCYKQVHVSLNNFLEQNQPLVTHLTLLLLEYSFNIRYNFRA
jgi:hypothetical protein